MIILVENVKGSTYSWQDRPYSADRYIGTNQHKLSDIQSSGYATPKVLTNLDDIGRSQNRSLHVWTPNNAPQSAGLKPYVIALTGHRPTDLISDGYNLGEMTYKGSARTDGVPQNPWAKVQDQFESILRDRISKHGYVEAHSGMADGADLVWARAILNVKYQVGLNRRKELVAQNPAYAKVVAQHQASGDQAWLRNDIYRLGADKIRFVADLPMNTQVYTLAKYDENGNPIKNDNGFNQPDQNKQGLYYGILSMADQVFSHAARSAKGKQRFVYEKCNQTMFMNADEGVAFATEPTVTGEVHDDTFNGMYDIKQFTGKDATVVRPEDFGITDNHRRSKQVSKAATRSVAASPQNSPQNRVEYLFAPSNEHHSYAYTPTGVSQHRYWWRKSNIDEKSPVSVNELMTALGSVMPNAGRRNSLQSLLTESLSDQVLVAGSDKATVNLIGQRSADGKIHEISPSDVETMITVLTLVHDSGIDYSVVQGADNSIALRLNDNSASLITLVDPQHPYLTGQVRTREGIYWSPELTRLPFETEAEMGTGLEMQHAIASSINEDGSEMVPIVHKNDGTVLFRNSERRLEVFKPRRDDYGSNNVPDVQRSRLVAQARYAGLDQTTKNKLAVAGIVNLLGVDKKILSKNTQVYLPDAKIETVNRLSSSNSNTYQAQINLGIADAEIAPVQVIEGTDGDEITTTSVPDNVQGKIRLDLRSAIVGDDRVDIATTNPRMNPYQVEKEDANELINVAYRDARIEYLKMLMGPDQDNSNRTYAQAQKKFKHLLSNDLVDVVADESGVGVKKVRREPLDMESQKLVLTAFKNGLLVATADSHGVDDHELLQNRKALALHVNDPILRARRVEVFDGLVAQMNETFGNAPIKQRVFDNNLDLSMDEYQNGYMDTAKFKTSKGYEQQELMALHTKMKSLLLDADKSILADVNSDGVDLDDQLNKMSYREQYARLGMIPDAMARVKAQHAYVELRDQLFNNYELHSDLNLTQVIKQTEAGANSTLYAFMMAQAVSKSDYADNLVGDNSYASETVQERAVQFDSDNAKRLRAYMDSVKAGEHYQGDDATPVVDFNKSTAMTISELRAADKDPNSDEFKLRQYMADVKAGRKTFSFDPAENPNPAAFNRDGSHLIRDISPNEFKARALEIVKKRLEARGVTVGDDDVKIDAQGVVYFKAQVPVYKAATHEQQAGGATYKKYDSATAKPTSVNKHGFETTAKGRVYRADNDGTNDLRYQPVEGTIGQIFAPDHDGLIRTAYNRFDGQDITAGQFTYQARYRGWILNPDRDESGNWSKESFREEERNGLGHFNRLRVMGYDQALFREVGQAVDTIISTRDVGTITRYNSNTIMNKLLHNEVLGNRVEEAALNHKVDEMSQAKRETELNAVRLEDAALAATKTTEVISYMKRFDETLFEMKLNGLLTNPNDAKETTLDVIRYMHDPISVYGGHGVGEVAHEYGNLLISDNMTGQGKMFGLLTYLVEGAKVTDDGRVLPNAFRNADGSYVKDAKGKIVGVASGTPIENTEFFDDSLKNAGDRQPVSKEQAIKGHETIDDVKIATMALGAYVMEDGLVVSKAFADTHQISDQVDGNGDPIYRSLTIGDKISDNGGNKATISYVIDPEMDLAEADRHGLLDIVQLFKQNPDLKVVMNEMSQISRNNGATGYTYLTRPSSKLMTYKRVRADGDGQYRETGEVVATNATINSGKLIITNQTINHKVTLYDKPSDDTGRKLSILLNNSDNTKGAHIVGNWHRRNGHNLQTLRESMLAMGVDLLPDRVEPADYDKIARETVETQYSIDADNLQKIKRSYHGLINRDMTFSKSAVNKVSSARSQKFVGVDSNGELKPASVRFLRTLRSVSRRTGAIAPNTDMMASDKYNAGEDFLQQLPDGGVLRLPEGVNVRTAGGKLTNELYILPERMRINTIAMDDTTVVSDFNRLYQNLGTNLAQYEVLVKATKEANLARGDAAVQAKINEQLAKELNIQGSVSRINAEANRFAFGGGSPKNGFFRNYVLGGYAEDSVTSQVSANPELPMDVIEISPAIAKRLNFVTGEDGMAHIDGHSDWGYLHVHRDPVWREQGSLGFRVKINDDLTGVRVSPVMAALMDADFDGDNLGLVSMPDAGAQRELGTIMEVDHWMLDNSKKSTLLNINAEIVEMAVNTSNDYEVTGRDGNVISGKFLDPGFRKQALESMRRDVVDPAWFDDQGNLTNVDKDGYPAVNDGDFLLMIVDNEIKTRYDKDDYRGARQVVDDIVQRARGFETSRDANGEVQISQGDVSILQGDGVDYTTEDTLRASLMKFANEGAKGKPSAVKGLIDDYMKKPLFSEVRAMGEAQVVDGQLNPQAREVYERELNGLHDTLLAVQRATKIKSDMTGVPGSMQQKITAVMMNTSNEGMHAAAAIGQAGTQKVLSIKRDPVMAGRVSEILQEPLGELLRGNFPNKIYPSFALLGPESQGRLGNDPSEVALRAATLRDYKVPGTDQTLREYPKSILSSDFTDDQVIDVANAIGVKIDPKNAQQLTDFRTTVDEATQPYLRDDFMKDLRQRIADKQGKDIRQVQVPRLKAEKNNQPDKVTRDEFVEIMDFLYNDKANGMGLGVDRKNFERLADVLVDPKSPTKEIRSIEDATKDGGFATITAKINMHGFSGVIEELTNQDQKDYVPANVFGKPGSYIRESVFGGMSADELNKQLSLSSFDKSLPSTVDTLKMSDQLDNAKSVVVDKLKPMDNVAFNTMVVSPAVAEKLGFVDGKLANRTDWNKLQLKSDGKNANVALNVKVDDQLTNDDVLINSSLLRELDNPAEVKLVAVPDAATQDALTSVVNNNMRNVNTFTKYQSRVQQQLAHDEYASQQAAVVGEVMTEFQADLQHRDEVQSKRQQTGLPDSHAILADLKAKTNVSRIAVPEVDDTARRANPLPDKVYARDLRVDSSGRYGMVENKDTQTLAFYGAYSPFSNLNAQPFKAQVNIDDNVHDIHIHDDKSREFNSVEQYVSYAKALMFKDEVQAAKILATEPDGAKNPWKSEADLVKNFDNKAWNTIAPSVLKAGMMAKFSQNTYVYTKLRDTGNATLVDAESKRGSVYGAGISLKDVANGEVFDGTKGQNVTGRLLEEVRTELGQGRETPKPTKVEIAGETLTGKWQPAIVETGASDAGKRSVGSSYDRVAAIVKGDYWSPITVRNVTGGTVNGQVGMAFLDDARKRNAVSFETEKTLRNANETPTDYRNDFVSSINQLGAEYQETVGSSLFDRDTNQRRLTNAYYVQMTTNETVADTLHQVRDNLQKFKLNRVRQAAIETAVAYYDKQHQHNVVAARAESNHVTKNATNAMALDR